MFLARCSYCSGVTKPSVAGVGTDARRDGVDADAARAELAGEHLGQPGDPALDRGIGAGIGPPAIGHGRGIIEDVALRALVAMGEEGLHAPEHALEPGRKHPVERFLGHLLDRFVDQHRGIVDQPRAAARRSSANARRDVEERLPLAEIAAIGDGRAARIADRARRRSAPYRSLMSHTPTIAPSAARCLAIPSPSPRPAPEIRIGRPSKRFMV